jgi:mono/diheme cytochrome c family protein
LGKYAGDKEAPVGPKHLEQGWDQQTRMEWWYTSQGSRVLPYDWFMALEQPDSEELIHVNANLVDRLRFIGWPKDETWNPDGLPIGFVKDTDKKTGESFFGFTCAACHTGLIVGNGSKWRRGAVEFGGAGLGTPSLQGNSRG